MGLLIMAAVVAAIAIALGWALVHEARPQLDPPPVVITLSVNTANFLEGMRRAAAAAAAFGVSMDKVRRECERTTTTFREMAEQLRRGDGDTGG